MSYNDWRETPSFLANSAFGTETAGSTISRKNAPG
jgi:hypothetical protein